MPSVSLHAEDSGTYSGVRARGNEIKQSSLLRKGLLPDTCIEHLLFAWILALNDLTIFSPIKLGAHFKQRPFIFSQITSFLLQK